MKKYSPKSEIQRKEFGIFPYIIFKSRYARFLQITIDFTTIPEYFLDNKHIFKIVKSLTNLWFLNNLISLK